MKQELKDLQSLLSEIKAYQEKHKQTLAEYDLNGSLEDFKSDTEYTIENIQEQLAWDHPQMSEFDMHNTLNHAQQGTTR